MLIFPVSLVFDIDLTILSPIQDNLNWYILANVFHGTTSETTQELF